MLPLRVLRQLQEPTLRPLQGLQRLRELRERVGALRRAHPVADRLPPLLRSAEVVRQPVQVLLDAVLTELLDGRPHPSVQLPALVLQQARIRHLLGQRVLEPIHHVRDHPRLLDQSRGLERFQRRRETLAVGGGTLQDSPGELAPYHRSEAQHIAGIPVQAIHAGTDHRLDGIRQVLHL